MKIRPIDLMLVKLEAAADAREVVLEECETYVGICQLLTDWDFGTVPTQAEKTNAYNSLHELFRAFGLDFETNLREIVLMEL